MQLVTISMQHAQDCDKIVTTSLLVALETYKPY